MKPQLKKHLIANLMLGLALGSPAFAAPADLGARVGDLLVRPPEGRALDRRADSRKETPGESKTGNGSNAKPEADSASLQAGDSAPAQPRR